MAHTKVTKTYSQNTGTANTFSYSGSFDTFKATEVVVELDNVALTYTTSTINESASPREYTVDYTNKTVHIGGADLSSGTVVIKPETDLGSPTPRATYAPGSSITAEDLNNNQTQLLRRAMEYEEQVMFKTGGVMTGTLEMGEDQVIKFEGATDNAHEITLTVADPSSDTTITLPNTTGTVVTTGDTATVTATMLAANSVDSSELVDGSIDSSHISGSAVTTDKIYADAVTGAKIADNAIDSEHYTDGSIDTAHIAAAQITTAKLADNAVTTVKITDGNITTAKIATDAVTGAKIADDQINSEHYVDGSIDTAHIADSQITTAKIAADAVTNAKIADDQIDSEHYVDGSIDTAHIGDNQVTTAKIADEDITTAKLATDAVTTVKITDANVTTAKIADNAVTTAKIIDDSVTVLKIADSVIITNSEQGSHSVDDLTFFTTSASDARYFNISSGDTIKDGDTFPDNDTTIATTAAINDRIIDLVDDVGGFVPIANETSFPTANPDVNNGAGTLVSIKALASNLVSNGSGVATIANGAGSGNTVTINGLANSTTYAATFGLIVETTSTLHTYTFHRQVPKATEVTTVAGSISNVNTVAGSISNVNAVAGNATNINAVAADATDIGAVAGKATEIGRLGTAAAVEDLGILGTAAIVEDMSLLGTTACVADMALLGESAVIADMATIADTSNLITNIGTVAGIQANVTTVAGVSANVTTTANNIANVNNFANTYQIASSAPSTDGGGNALAAGDLYFDTSASELKVRNAANNAWQGGVTATGNLIAKGGDEFTGAVGFTDGSTGTPSIYNVGDTNTGIYFGAADEVDVTAGGTTRLEINSDGIDVTGNITLSGNITGTNLSSTGGSNITIAPDGAGDIYLSTDTIHVGGAGEDVMISSHGAGDLTLCTAQGSNSGSIEIEDGANNDILITPNGTGDVIIDGLKYPQADGSAGQFLKTDGSAQLSWDTPATVGGATGVDFNDGVKIRLGTGNDLELYHTSGSESYIDNSNGHLFIQNGGSNDDSNVYIRARDGEDSIVCHDDGAVELYYDNSKKFATKSDGAFVHGDANGAYFILADTSSNYCYQLIGQDAVAAGAGGRLILADADGGTVLDLRQAGNNVFCKNSFKLNVDNLKTIWGAGDDLEIYHNGTNSVIDNNTGTFLITSDDIWFKDKDDGDVHAKFIHDGAVELYHDNVKTFETNSDGITVQAGEGSDGKILLNADEGDDNADKWRMLAAASSSAFYLSNYTSGGWETNLKLDGNGGVTLYYNDVSVFKTNAGGCDIMKAGASNFHIGSTDASGAYLSLDGDSNGDAIGSDYCSIIHGTDGDLSIHANNPAGDSQFELYVGAADELSIVAAAAGGVTLHHNGSAKFSTTAAGCSATTGIDFPDSQGSRYGASGDLKMYHNGTNSYITNDTGRFYIDADATEFVGYTHNYLGDSTGSPHADSILILEDADNVIIQTLTQNDHAVEMRFGDQDDNGAGWMQYAHGTNTWSVGTNGTQRMYINSGGSLYVQGAYDATTGSGANMEVASSGKIRRSTSSRRYKTSIETLEDKYADAILEARPVWYKSLCEDDNKDHGHWGFIAEEIEKIDPRLCTYKTVEIETNRDVLTEKKLDTPIVESVQYDRFVPHLINLIKRQDTKIKALETKVTALEAG